MITKKQIQLIKICQKQLGFEDAEYRLVLRNIGKVSGEKPSCKLLTQKGFEDVMAFFEKCGANVSTGNYWQDRSENRLNYATSREIFMIASLARDQQYDIAALCMRHSHQRTPHPSKLYRNEAYELIEMLKAVIDRNKAGA